MCFAVILTLLWALGRASSRPEGTQVAQLHFLYKNPTKVRCARPVGQVAPAAFQHLLDRCLLQRGRAASSATTRCQAALLFVRHPVCLASDISTAERRAAQGLPAPILSRHISHPHRQPRKPAGQAKGRERLRSQRDAAQRNKIC